LQGTGDYTFCQCSSDDCAWYTGNGASCRNPRSDNWEYGPIFTWNVSQVTSMNRSECVPIPSLQPSLSISFPSVSSLYLSFSPHRSSPSHLSLFLCRSVPECQSLQPKHLQLGCRRSHDHEEQ
jgi:hypothetical protein